MDRQEFTIIATRISEIIKMIDEYEYLEQDVYDNIINELDSLNDRLLKGLKQSKIQNIGLNLMKG